MALLFATYQVRPSPFCLLDEIDAALDDKNVGSLVNVLRAFSGISQYIVITHNKKTVLGASSMLGVVMEESGVTKVVQVRLDDDMLNGKAAFEAEDDFVEEDVEPEEGIVIPPRPPKRERDQDGNVVESGENEPENADSEEISDEISENLPPMNMETEKESDDKESTSVSEEGKSGADGENADDKD